MQAQTLSDALRPWLDSFVDREGKQQILAIRFLEQFPKRSWKLNYVEPRLSRMLGGKVDATRFFFEDRARAKVLLDLLEVPDGERAGLLELADTVIRTGGDPAPRLVIDAAPLSNEQREETMRLFDALEQSFLNQRILRPVLLVITDEQFKLMPRTFDNVPDFKVERRPDAAAAWQRVQEAAGDEALIATCRTLDGVDRWLALGWRDRELLLEPADALDRFAADGVLPALPQIQHPLTLSDGGTRLPAIEAPRSGVERRRLIFALADEGSKESLELSPLNRLALARQLGVEATSTPRERLELELQALTRQLGIEVQVVEPAVLQEVIDRAVRRPVQGQAMRVGDELHLVNPSQAQAQLEHPRLKIHRVAYQKPAMARLLEAIDDWSVDEWREDPQLMGLIDRLDPDMRERLAFLHARASLLWCEGSYEDEGDPLPDWRSGLLRLLAGEPPAASLRLSVVGGSIKVSEYGPARAPFIALQDEASILQAWGGSALSALPEPLARMLWQTPPGTSEIFLDRDETAAVFTWEPADQRSIRYADPGLVLPIHPDLVFDPARWLDCFEAGLLPGHAVPDSTRQQLLGAQKLDRWGVHLEPQRWNPRLGTWERDYPAYRFPAIEQGRVLAASPFVATWNPVPLTIPEQVWRDADRDLALVWLTLKRAAREEAVRLHDGRILLPLGAGIFAEITVRACDTVPPEEDPMRAGLVGTVKRDAKNVGWELDSLHSMVITHRATTTGYGTAQTELGYSLPRTLFLAGHGLRADISFVSAPFFQGHLAGPSLETMAAAGARLLEARAADDASDDD